ncbi:MAG: hypothetical protein LUG16_05920 [Candidatus Gastranaerophilales bacterium]|nr:hypothetical protein [Candidatus Gastranaerophilales bacterium]
MKINDGDVDVAKAITNMGRGISGGIEFDTAAYRLETHTDVDGTRHNIAKYYPRKIRVIVNDSEIPEC